MLSFEWRKTSPPLAVISPYPLFFAIYYYCIVAAPFLGRDLSPQPLPCEGRGARVTPTYHIVRGAALAAVAWLAIVRERDIAERGDAVQPGGGANRVGDGASERLGGCGASQRQGQRTSGSGGSGILCGG